MSRNRAKVCEGVLSAWSDAKDAVQHYEAGDQVTGIGRDYGRVAAPLRMHSGLVSGDGDFTDIEMMDNSAPDDTIRFLPPEPTALRSIFLVESRPPESSWRWARGRSKNDARNKEALKQCGLNSGILDSMHEDERLHSSPRKPPKHARVQGSPLTGGSSSRVLRSVEGMEDQDAQEFVTPARAFTTQADKVRESYDAGEDSGADECVALPIYLLDYCLTIYVITFQSDPVRPQPHTALSQPQPGLSHPIPPHLHPTPHPNPYPTPSQPVLSQPTTCHPIPPTSPRATT